ncbi:MAG: hypothetical protein OEM02_14935 [Desulfobulbaceae bacterium]|nr:hypothetical protein [Desulfobulbaceae bacterium]
MSFVLKGYLPGISEEQGKGRGKNILSHPGICAVLGYFYFLHPLLLLHHGLFLIVKWKAAEALFVN